MILHTILILGIFTSNVLGAGDQSSCATRGCDQSFSSSLPCQCNSQCSTHHDCCADYLSVCQSCAGKCSNGYSRGAPCQCNSQCSNYHNCCPDHQSQCAGGATITGTCLSIDQLAQQMWDKDSNRLRQGEISLNYQHQISDGLRQDLSSQKLFNFANSSKLQGLTFRTFLSLLDNYRSGKGDAEISTLTEKQEEDAFLEAILDTDVMKALQSFLVCNNRVSDRSDLKQKLQSMWFDFYPRSGSSSIPDTSGFEHIMVGEYKSSSQVNGFHNWMSFYKEEQKGDLNYYGYVTLSTVEDNNALIGAAFNWEGRVKDLGSFFVGVSPEFDIGIYSLCFFMYPGKVCHFDINSKSFTIQSYSSHGHIATAYAKAGFNDPTVPIVG